MPPTVLVVEDDPSTSFTLQETLRREGYEIASAADGETALDAVTTHSPDLIILDVKLPEMSGLEVLRRLRATGCEVPVIVVTSYGNVQMAVEAIKLGAFDFVQKPFELAALRLLMERALEVDRLRHEQSFRHEREARAHQQGLIVYRSQVMRNVMELVARIHRHPDVTVLIEGETGTGKNLIAREIHYSGSRRRHPFIDIECAALPANLLEHELFGSEPGAFTGARNLKRGLFEVADGGTVLLDEISDIPLDLQTKLLRFLEQKSFRRIGGVRNISVDVMIVAATNQDLRQLVAQGRFRLDLFHRLAVLPIRIAPLRERREDVVLLAEHFLTQLGEDLRKPIPGFEPGALEALTAYSWPGNVRELRNVLERIVILRNADTPIQRDEVLRHLDVDSGAQGPQSAGRAEEDEAEKSPPPTLEEQEKQAIVDALQRADGNITRAARLLGIGRDALRYRLKKYGIR